MLIQIILFLFFGVLAGIFTGLAPGIHINLVGIILLGLSTSILSFILPIYFVVFITAMSIAHTFIDFIPSIFLGCPNSDTELSILPGHQMLKQGKGFEAIYLTSIGGLLAIFLLPLISIPSIIFISKIYPLINVLIPFFLILVILSMIFTENSKSSALLVILLTGFLGLCVLNLEELKQPLLPLLTGLFGSSMLIKSITEKTKIPKQDLEIEKINKKEIFKPLFSALFSSLICGFLPGLGSGQAAILGSQISKTDNKTFLILLGATNILVMVFSFISLYAISKTRTGSAVAIQELVGALNGPMLFLILIICLISGIFSFYISLVISKRFIRLIEKIDYSKMSLFILGILILVTIIFSSFLGLLILLISTLTGIYCISLNVKRTHMMGCLLIPTIFLYLI